MTDAYRDCLDYLYGRLDYERAGMPRSNEELKLGRMRRLLRRLGEPQEAAPIIHVAGTKGKGSTAAMIAAALGGSGMRTGLFCSPHLHRLEERFAVDGRPAEPGELAGLVEAVRPAVADLDVRAEADGERPLTFFEVTTAMGLLHFARKGCGAVVLEVGMGGRLDSTNAVRPAVSVLTTISFDHTRQLGNTLGAIAGEKAGIVKRATPVVSGVRGDEPAGVIRRIALQRRAPLREVDVDFTFEHILPARPLARPSAGRVAVRTWRRDWGELDLPLMGPHQALNAAVALAAFDALADRGPGVDRAAVERGFARLAFPARVEVLGERPWLVVDGAHNVASAEALGTTLDACFPPGPRTLVFGTTREKDLPGQVRALLPGFDAVIATRYVDNPRAVPTAEVAEAVRAVSGREAIEAPDPASALDLARRLTPPDGLICVTGSLFLAAEARAAILGIEPAPRPGTVTT